MLKGKITKIIFVLACIVTLVMPYTSSVLAVKLKETDTKVNLISVNYREGQDESSGTLTEEQRSIYDTSSYEYYVGGESAADRVLKIASQDSTIDFSNIFYCIDFSKQFPSESSGGLEYTKIADMKDSTDINVKSLHMSTEQATDNAKWTENYKALLWLFDNIYLKNVTPNQKDEFIQKAFAGSYYDEEGILGNVKAALTDDDIEVVQQLAMWYFTNNDYEKEGIVDGQEVRIPKFNVENLPAFLLEKATVGGEGELKPYNRIATPIGGNYGETDISRQEMANILYKYLISSAKAAATTGSSSSKTFPTISKDESLPKKTDENYYVVGPLKIAGGNASSSEYKIYLTDQNNNKINESDYKILINGETSFTNKSLNEIKDKSVYAYIPKTNKNVTKVNFKLEYSTYKTNATLWKNNDEYQPVVLLDRIPDPKTENVPFDIEIEEEPKEFDLALRKYVVSVNGKTIDNAKPEVDSTKLQSGEAKTATYKHAKTPVEVSSGDRVVFEIRVYNEGEVDSTRLLITEALPTGLEIVEKENSTINTTYGWTEAGGESTHKNYVTTINSSIKAYDKENNVLDSKAVQIECRVSDKASATSILTNLAEITDIDKTADGKTLVDRDSENGNNSYVFNDIDASNYTGDKDNKTDLTDKNYHYKGLEDDDDFAKVVIKGKSFDLNLKKFITKVNGKELETSREPKVVVNDLKEGKSTDATYTKSGSKISVKKGDLVTYKIRVYNEGDLAGYAEEVMDYIPEGLGYLVTYKGNVDNQWKLADESTKSNLLSELGVEATNIKLSDFVGESSAEKVEVVKGKNKIVTKALSSEDSRNLIKAFDKENGTTLDYKDIEITCIVIADEIANNNGRNIAEITKQSDENKKEITDRDSTPDTVDPDNYPDKEKRPDGKTYQDDNDYEDLTNPKAGVFDLALQKFITELYGKKVSGREPTVSVSNGKVSYKKSTEDNPLKVENNDLVTYTIRVYNEGTIAGYAKEISDNIPNGLEFVKDNDTNKKYGWKLYDKNGNETSDVKQATTVKTNYLSKSASENGKYDALLNAFDSSKTASSIPYKDVHIVFKVVESVVPKDKDSKKRQLINIAEISDDEDENGNPIEDVDSKPGDHVKQDDLDQEEVYVKIFDLKLQKYLSKIIIVEDGKTREIAVSETDGLQKVEVHRKKINSTTVKFVYDIVVINEGEIEGYAQEITDNIPDGLEFIQDDNKVWTKTGNKITTEALANTLIKPGEKATVQVSFKWVNGENNFGVKTNVAEISKDRNDSNTSDIDSTPGNNKSGEDDIDTAEVMLSISTGTAPTYLALAITVLTILSTGIVLIKKYVLA